jgi:CHAT domain-containing protein
MQRSDGPPHDSALVQVWLATSLAHEADPAGAIRYALEAEELSRALLMLTTRYLPERQALSFAAKRARAIDLALSLVAAAPTASADIFDRVIRSRAVILDEMGGRNHRTTDAAVAETARLYATLTAARQRLANLVVRGPGRQRRDQYDALVDEVRREKEQAETALAATSAAFRSEQARRDMGLSDVRTALGSDTALVSIVRYERTVVSRKTPASSPLSASPPGSTTVPSYMAFVLRASDVAPAAVPLGDATAIDRLVTRWRAEMLAGLARAPGATRAAERTLRTLGTQLRQRVWDPVAKHIADAARVFVVPDGSLNLIPFAALPVGETDYLLEKGPTLHYVSAERDLGYSGAAPATGNGLLALGGAAFGEASLFAALGKTTGTVGSAADTASGTFRGAAPDCVGFQSMRFRPLPGSRSEAAEVAGLWREHATKTTPGAGSPQILAGREASERAFKQLGPGHRIVHLATHGYFLGNACQSALDATRAVGGLTTAGQKAVRTNPQPIRTGLGESPLLLSGLALAGANRRAAAGPDEEDGILTAEEVASLNLSGVEWAVLSACDTGLGEIKAGEGVFGLRRAFQVAGARTVIMSLWSVEDRSAMEWMRALYEGRLRWNLDTADSVREASLTILRQRRARNQNTHPFFWAGFVASGDWR